VSGACPYCGIPTLRGEYERVAREFFDEHRCGPHSSARLARAGARGAGQDFGGRNAKRNVKCCAGWTPAVDRRSQHLHAGRRLRRARRFLGRGGAYEHRVYILVPLKPKKRKVKR